MSERFFSAEPIASNRAELADVLLTGSEAHHFLHVMRGGVGDRITLFDGGGSEFAAEVTACRRSEVELAVGEELAVDRELAFELTVGVALPKGDRQKWLVEKLTELGVTRLVPLETERSVAQPTPNTLGRLEKSVVEACKQCGRNRLMELASATAWSTFVSNSGVSEPGVKNNDSTTKLLAHPSGEPMANVWPRKGGDCVIAIGPEGGLTEGEVEHATAAGWQAVSLGQRILRVETAAIALAASIALESAQAVAGREGTP